MDKLFIGLIIGLLGGVVFGVFVIADSPASEPTTQAARPESSGVEGTSPTTADNTDLENRIRELESRLATAQRDRDQVARDAARYLSDRQNLQQELAAAKSNAGRDSYPAEVEAAAVEQLTEAQIAARKAEAVRITGDIKIAIEAKDKATVLQHLEAMKALGPSASAEYFAALKDVLAVGTPQWWGARGNDNANALGLDWNEYQRLMTRELRDIALEQASGGQIPPEVMRLAGFLVRQDPYMPQERQVELLTTMLRSSPDTETMSSAVRSLANVGTPEAVSQLHGVATNGGNDSGVRELAVWQLGREGANDSTVEVIKTLQTDTDERVATAARRTLQRLRPAMTGYLIETVGQQGQARTAGLQVGDIIIRYNGQDVTHGNLRQFQNSIPEGMTGELVVWRDGAAVTVLVRRGQLGVDGQFVRRVQQ